MFTKEEEKLKKNIIRNFEIPNDLKLLQSFEPSPD